MHRIKKGVGIRVASFILIVVSVAALFLFFRQEQEILVEEVREKWEVAELHHIELLNRETEAFLFFETEDGREVELLMERHLFSWDEKASFEHSKAEQERPIQVNFFESPFEDEEKISLVIIRVFDNEIQKVDIMKEEELLTSIDIQPEHIGTAEGFGIAKTRKRDIYKAEIHSYNEAGELVHCERAAEL